MNKNDKNQDLQLWVLACPLIAIATSVILLMKGTTAAVYLSWMLLAGSLLSWRWKERGLIVSLLLLALLVGFEYLAIPPEERLWHLGASIAIAVTFFVVSFSFAEAEQWIFSMQTESNGRLKNLMQMDEKLEAFKSSFDHEKKQLFSELNKEKSKTESYERLVQESRKEVLGMHEEQNKLFQELTEKRSDLEYSKQKLLELAKLSQEQTERDQLFASLQEELLSVKEREGSFKQELDSLALLSEEDKKARKWKSMYEQMRQQFEEKGRLLDEARRDLFRAEERVAGLLHEQREARLERTEGERELERCLVELEEECVRLADDITLLEDRHYNT